MFSFIWTICYLSVLVGLSAYGVHRYFIIYLFLKNRKRAPVPAGRFEQLPVVTVQLPATPESVTTATPGGTSVNVTLPLGAIGLLDRSTSTVTV